MAENLSVLVDKVLTQFHEKHRADFEFLIPLAQKVESVHGDKSECPNGLAKFLVQLKNDLEMHMQKEEQILFPMIKAGRGFAAEGPIHVMMSEHEDHLSNLVKLKKMAKDFIIPGDACGSWRTLNERVQLLSKEISEHIEYENTILFPKSLKPEGSSCCGSCS